METIRKYEKDIEIAYLKEDIPDLLKDCIDGTGRVGKIVADLKNFAQGHDVKIAISDTGPGIPPENLSKIFDPFFTTKAVGKGTGLGMNIAYNIIKEHKGNIEVHSEMGKGTCFTITLPGK